MIPALPRFFGTPAAWRAVKRVAELTEEGRMAPAGLEAFARRRQEKTAVYAYEREHAALPPSWQTRFESKKKAFSYWNARPPWYRRGATYWVVSAKREETRVRRFVELLEACAEERPIKHLARP